MNEQTAHQNTTSACGKAYFIDLNGTEEKRINEEILLEFQEISPTSIQIKSLEKTHSEKNWLILIFNIWLDSGHQYNQEDTHLNIQLSKSKDNSEIKNLAKKSQIAKALFEKNENRGHINLNSSELDDIKENGSTAIHNIVRKKLNVGGIKYQIISLNKKGEKLYNNRTEVNSEVSFK